MRNVFDTSANDMPRIARSFKASVVVASLIAALTIVVPSRLMASGGKELEPDGRAKISAEDVGRLATFLNAGSFDHRARVDRDRRPWSHSPDGKSLAVFVHRGVPDEGTTQGEIYIFDVLGGRIGTAPRLVRKFSSTENWLPMIGAKWASDSSALIFGCSNLSELPQICRLDRESGAVTRLTNLKMPMASFLIDPALRVAIIKYQPSRAESLDSNPACEDGCLVGGRNIVSTYGYPRSPRFAIVNIGQDELVDLPEAITEKSGLEKCRSDPLDEISPDGRFVAFVCRQRSELRPRCAELRLTCYDNIVFFDLLRKTMVIWRDSRETPSAISDQSSTWIEGGRKLALLSPESTERRTSSSRNSGEREVLLIDPSSGRTVERIMPPSQGQVVKLSWDAARSKLLAIASDKDDAAGQTYRFEGGGWRQLSATAGADEPRCSIEVLQSVNSRPRLVSRCVGDQLTATLLDPNEWLDDRQVGRVEPVTWQAGGRTWRGGIIYPPNFDASKLYPLVIQTHGFRENVFSLSGASDNYPGHALAAYDFVVLEVAENEFASDGLPQVFGTPASWENARVGYEAAIDYLTSRGIVDKNRVGMIGWSATGPYVGYMTTHSNYRISAVAFTDTMVFGWYPYILRAASQPYEDIFGGPPFGIGLKTWIEASPAFNLDRVRTPYLIWGAKETTGYAEWYHLLRRLESPVEAWLFTKGSHHMYREPARVRSVELLIDWFRFWLTGQRDADSTKSEQYARWGLLRQQQVELERVLRRPLLDWTAVPREQ